MFRSISRNTKKAFLRIQISRIVRKVLVSLHIICQWQRWGVRNKVNDTRLASWFSCNIFDHLFHQKSINIYARKTTTPQPQFLYTFTTMYLKEVILLFGFYVMTVQFTPKNRSLWTLEARPGTLHSEQRILRWPSYRSEYIKTNASVEKYILLYHILFGEYQEMHLRYRMKRGNYIKKSDTADLQSQNVIHDKVEGLSHQGHMDCHRVRARV